MAISRPRGYIEPPPRARLAEFAGTEFDEAALSAAQRAVARVVARHPTLLVDEVAKLTRAWAAAPERLDGDTVAPVFGVAHELAGLGGTFGYPLVTILARSLCRLLTMGDLGRAQMADVVDAHIATLHVITRDRIQGHGGELGLSLATTLDRAIVKFSLSAGGERPNRLREEVAALQTPK